MSAYFTKVLGADHVPNFIKASTASGLRRLMSRNSIRLKGFVQYFDIQYVQDEKAWYAWYFVTDKEASFREVMEEGSN